MVINAGSLCGVIGERIEGRTAWKFCGICKKKLSMYNNGKYCFAHSQVGLDKDIELWDRKSNNTRKKFMKKYNKKRVK